MNEEREVYKEMICFNNSDENFIAQDEMGHFINKFSNEDVNFHRWIYPIKKEFGNLIQEVNDHSSDLDSSHFKYLIEHIDNVNTVLLELLKLWNSLATISSSYKLEDIDKFLLDIEELYNETVKTIYIKFEMFYSVYEYSKN